MTFIFLEKAECQQAGVTPATVMAVHLFLTEHYAVVCAHFRHVEMNNQHLCDQCSAVWQ